MIFLLTVNYNSLPDRTKVDYKLLIVNNSQEDVALNALQNEFISIIHSQKNVGFGSACNVGIRSIFEIKRDAIIWIVNPDAYSNSKFKIVT